jgi:predicted nucleic acid-binding protein
MKKETLEEAAEKFCNIPEKQSGDKYKFSAQDRLLYNTFIEGAKWQAERMYSEDEVINIQKKYSQHCYEANNNPFTSDEIIPFKKWLKTNK